MAEFRKLPWTLRNRPPIPRLREEEITPSSGWTQYPEFHHLLVDLPGFGKDDIKFNVEESGIIVVSGRRRIGEEKQEYFEKSFNVPEDGDIRSITTVFEGDTLKVSIPKVAKDMKQEPIKTNGASSSSSDTKKKIEDKKESKDLEKPSSDSSKDIKEGGEDDKRKVDQSLISTKEKIQQEYDENPALSSEKMEDNNNSSLSSNDKMEDKAEQLQSSKQHKSKDQKQNIGPDRNHQGENSSSQTSVIVKIIENKGILIASILSFTLGVFLSQKFHPLPPPK